MSSNKWRPVLWQKGAHFRKYSPSKEPIVRRFHNGSKTLSGFDVINFLTLTSFKTSYSTGQIFWDVSPSLCMTQWVNCASGFSFQIRSMSLFTQPVVDADWFMPFSQKGTWNIKNVLSGYFALQTPAEKYTFDNVVSINVSHESDKPCPSVDSSSWSEEDLPVFSPQLDQQCLSPSYLFCLKRWHKGAVFNLSSAFLSCTVYNNSWKWQVFSYGEWILALAATHISLKCFGGCCGDFSHHFLQWSEVRKFSLKMPLPTWHWCSVLIGELAPCNCWSSCKIPTMPWEGCSLLGYIINLIQTHYFCCRRCFVGSFFRFLSHLLLFVFSCNATEFQLKIHLLDVFVIETGFLLQPSSWMWLCLLLSSSACSSSVRFYGGWQFRAVI